MPLQKSFSDTNHSSKAKQPQRTQWHRNKSFQGQQPTKTTSKPLQEKSAIAVSTATKNKLSAFKLDQKNTAENASKAPIISLLSDDEKENETASSKKTVRALQEWGKEGPKQASQEFLKLPEPPKQPHQRLPPSTPVGKLNIADLIGMSDIRREINNVSPEERLEWDHKKDMDVGSALHFQGVRRIRKRARSSSPIGSSPARDAMQIGSNSVNGSQQADPGSELWGRYSFNGSNAPKPQGQAMAVLANVVQNSAPKKMRETPEPRSIPNFRRASSCGNQFPKRRRVGAAEGIQVFTESAAIGPSKLSVLIERVQEGLSHPKSIPALSKTSSDLKKPDEEYSSDTANETPMNSKEQQKAPRVSKSSNNTSPSDHCTGKLLQMEPAPKPMISSDYGDEFDDDDLNAGLMEDFEEKKDVSKPVKPFKPSSKAPPDLPPPPCSLIKPKVEQLKYTTAASVERDEFDESDDDIFTADLEHIASQFDSKRSVAKVQPRVIADSDDEFGDDVLDDIDFEAAEASATQSVQQSANSLLPSTQKVQAIQRYLVTTILESEFDTPQGRKQKEKILLLQIDDSKVMKVCHLRGFWLETPVTPKAFVHVIGTFDRNGRCVIDDNNNLLILHPDHLISATVVADSFGCTRRAVLQDRVKATNESTAPLVYGTILHEIFQAAMLENRWDTLWLEELIQKVAQRHLEDLYMIRVQVSQAVEYLKSKMLELQSWAEMFVSSKPKSDAVVKAGHGETALMCVSKLLDVEEHVWSPMYGLKGNIDATVQVTMQEGGSGKQRTLTVPFEVKTGRNPSAAHRAQTALYNLLLSDRYDVQIAYGILYYMETSETLRIPAIRHELRHMIMQRNELACFVRERHTQLPPMLKKENICNRCYAKTTCFIYHKLADDGTGETSGMKTKFDEVVKHLTPKHKEFFLKWDDLLTKEEKEGLKFRRELWTMLSSEREILGRCFSNVIIEPGSAYEEQNNPKINRYRYSLIKDDPPAGFSFLDSQIIVGEPIVISDEQGHFALANGFVTNVRKGRVTVAVDRRLHNARIRQPGFDEVDNQVFASIMDVAPERSTPTESKPVEKPIKYRLDKDEFSNGMVTARNNLIQVMADGPSGSRQIRGLVVDLNAPRYKSNPTNYVLKDRNSLNVDQRRAIAKVMTAEDYALVLGMPGTGKTTTIAHIIRALVSQGKSVLLTSYTHTAVDNILLKLKDDSIPILRLGTISKIAMEVQEFATLAATIKNSFEEIREAWHGCPVVATTCLGINHALFNERNFDYCIVDEASQITLPTCIGPIRLAKTFVLVGDHNQLPPLVQNEEARTGGLDISLFKLLSDAHPSSVVYLEHQYRMCEDVMALSNNLIYHGRLKCGSQEVAARSIVIPNMDGLKNHHFSPSTLSRSQKSVCLGAKNKCWIRHLVQPETKVAFINTDPLLPISREQDKGNRIVNPTEATIVAQLVESLLSVGVPASDIGVMTHYRSQLALLKDSLRAHPDVEMHTADRFQGRDKEVIILSLVRSNEAKSIGELLKDWRRINVAFTRAKTKLMVVGSRETLKGNGVNKNGEEEMVARFVTLMEERRWVFDLPVNALEEHLFEDVYTQGTGSSTQRPSTSTQWRPVDLGKKKQMQRQIKGDMEDVIFTSEKDKKRKAVGEEKENVPVAAAIPYSSYATTGAGFEIVGIEGRKPNKRVFGQKPFKQSTMIRGMGVLNDVMNEVMNEALG